MKQETPITDAATIHVLDPEATRMSGSQVEGVYKLYVSPLVARKLETNLRAVTAALGNLLPVARVLVDEGYDAGRLEYPSGNTSELLAAVAALSAARANFPDL